MINRKQLGRNIKTIRKNKSITQEAAADALEISRTYYARIERGTRNATLETLETIIAMLDASWQQVLTGATDNRIITQDLPSSGASESAKDQMALLLEKCTPGEILCLVDIGKRILEELHPS